MTTAHIAARVSGTIRQLEWHDDPENCGEYWFARAWAGVYCYEVGIIDAPYETWWWQEDAVTSAPSVDGFPTKEAAKAAAQDDYEARILAAIQPDPEPQPVAWLWLSADGRVRSASNDPPDQGHLDTAQADGDRIIPVHANSSSAGTVSVEAAARVLLDACPNPIFDTLKPALMGEVTEREAYIDEDGNEAYYDKPVSWDAMKKTIRAALRALAGEGGR